MNAVHTVLVVDDEEPVRTGVCRVLRAEGYAVLEASGPLAALEWCERTGVKVDVLVSDVRMPGMNGCELALRAKDLQKDARVLFMTGDPYGDEAERAMARCSAELIAKPFFPAELVAKLRQMLDRG